MYRRPALATGMEIIPADSLSCTPASATGSISPKLPQQGIEIHGRRGVKLDGVLVRVQLLAVAHDLHVTHRIGAGRDEQGQLVVHAGLDGSGAGALSRRPSGKSP